MYMVIMDLLEKLSQLDCCQDNNEMLTAFITIYMSLKLLLKLLLI